jgi:hypothetical protein
MYTISQWRDNQLINHTKHSYQVSTLLKSGSRKICRITYTYVSVFDFEMDITRHFFIFLPFINNYSIFHMGFPPYGDGYFFLKDDYTFVGEDFFKCIHNGRNICVKEYKDNLLQDIEYTFVSSSLPIILGIEYDSKIDTRTYDEWMNDKTFTTKVAIKFNTLSYTTMIFPNLPKKITKLTIPGKNKFCDVEKCDYE